MDDQRTKEAPVSPPSASKQNSPYWRLVLFGIFGSFIGMWPYGYQSTVLNIPQGRLEGMMNRSYYNQMEVDVGTYGLAGLWSFTVSVFLIGVVSGSLAAAFLAQRYGRRVTFFIICGLVMILGSILMGLAFSLGVFELLIFGRYIAGFSSGISVAVLGMYITEVSPNRFRGTIAAIQGVMAVTGLLIGTILSFPMVIGNSPTNVSFLLGITLIPGLLQVLLFPAFPESPKYLYTTRRDRTGAVASLRFYHGPKASVEECLAEYDTENSMASRSLSLVDVLGNPNLRWPVILGCVSSFAAMDSGRLALMNYSTHIMETVGLTPETADFGTLAISAVSVLGTIIGVFLMKTVKRRVMFLGGLSIILFCNIVFPLVKYASDKTGKSWLAYISLVLLVIELTSSSMFVQNIYWFISSEMTPQIGRSIASSLSMATGGCTSVILIQIFLVLNKAIGSWSFMILFAAPSIFTTLFLFKYLPETKDRSIEEIVAKWWIPDGSSKLAKMPNVYAITTANNIVCEKL